MSDNTGTKGKGGMEAFDQLPPRLRQALNNYPMNMSSEYALAMLKRGKTEDELLTLLELRRNSP